VKISHTGACRERWSRGEPSVSTAIAPLFDPEHLEKHETLTTVINLTFRGVLPQLNLEEALVWVRTTCTEVSREQASRLEASFFLAAG
jgi:hypothetical protein